MEVSQFNPDSVNSTSTNYRPRNYVLIILNVFCSALKNSDRFLPRTGKNWRAAYTQSIRQVWPLFTCIALSTTYTHPLFTPGKRMPHQRSQFVRRLRRQSKSAPPTLLGQSNKRKLWMNEQILAALKAVEGCQPINQAACDHGILRQHWKIVLIVEE